jgi:hypothetical protein
LALRRAEATFRASAAQVAHEAGVVREDAEAAGAAIAIARMEETFSLGVTGDDARRREYADGAVRLAAQRWQAIVAETAVKR